MKKLVKEFSKYLHETDSYGRVEMAVREFWFAKFGSNNPAKETELLEYWRTKKHEAGQTKRSF